MEVGTLPPGFVTVKVSVRHWFLFATLTAVAPALSMPESAIPTTALVVLGPVIVNKLKSNRSYPNNSCMVKSFSDKAKDPFKSVILQLIVLFTWQMLLLHLQDLNWH